MSRARKTPSADIGALTTEQVVALLANGEQAALLRAYFGDVDYLDLRKLARRAIKARKGRKPRVYLLPGIMGSSLGYRGKSDVHEIWLNPEAVAAGELLSLALPDARPVQPLNVLLPGYLQLYLALIIAGFDVVFHPFDWRKSVVASGQQLLQRITRERKQSVAIVAHSMGGLVARAALATDRRRRIGKIVQLGTPNFGSFALVQALRAVYASVRKVVSLDSRHSPEQVARHVFRSLPGIYEMLPIAAHARDADLFDLQSWPDDLLGPDATMLAHARRVRDRLANGRAGCFHIVGSNRETITAVIKKRGGFEYGFTLNGDGTVPRSLAEWPGAQHYFAEELHGNLTKNPLIAAAIIDLLRKGRTAKLPGEKRAVENKIVRLVSDAQLRSD